MNLEQASGLKFEINNNSLDYKKEDYAPAVDWSKSFKDAEYAYNIPETNLETIYYGARYMEKTIDQDLLLKHDLMADATVVNPGKVGEEFVKTVGHYHGYKDGTDVAFPEVYEVVKGRFEYLLQSEPDIEGKVDVIWVIAEEGDKVVMPPGYGHVSINVGSDPAVEVDIQKRDNPNQSDYTMFKENNGGAFYRTAEGLVKNENYKIKSLRIVKPNTVPEWGLEKSIPLYTSVINNPEKFAFLTSPENYVFDLDLLFIDVEL